MLIKLIDKYILKEVAYPFIMGVFIITIILVGNYFFQLADLIIVKEVPVKLVAQLLFYRLPGVIVETFPIAVLFAAMTAVGRLNRENEITALRMGGISIYRLMIPLFILGLLISGMTFFLNENIVPWANHRSRNIVRETILKEAVPNPEEEVFFKGPQGRLFYVKNYDQQREKLHDIVIYDLKESEKFPEVITAEEGSIDENIWILNKGIIHQYNENGKIILQSQFENMQIQLSEDIREISGTQKTTSEMSRKELSSRIKLFQDSGIKVNSLLVDYHLKLAEPFTALIFILISVPLSLSGKESRIWNLILTVFIIFFYYVILSFSRSFGRNEVLSPITAAWLPNLIFFIIGIMLLIWRESWQKIINRFSSFFAFCFLIFFLIISPFSVQAEVLNLEAKNLNYNQSENLLEISGNISGNYGKFYVKSDNINIILKEDAESEADLSRQAEEVKLRPGIISGCDFENPHYFFNAEKVNIYPGDYLEMYNVSFRELNGKLPLFYWPYLYISLDREQQNFFPSFGYHERRGWFVKTKYFYNNRFDLPGNIYLDYYTISGSAGGIKQYFLNEDNHQAYLYYYTQQNKTDLYGLFNWEAELFHQYSAENWDEEFSYLYQDYDDKEEIESVLSLNSRTDDRYTYSRLDYDEVNYFGSADRDDEDYNFKFYQRDEILGGLNYRFNYDIDFERDPEDGLSKEENRRLDLGYTFANSWNLDLNYYDGEKDEPGEALLDRQGGEVSLNKRYQNTAVEILWERYAPGFSEEDEDKVVFSREPELKIDYFPAGNFDYSASYGNYYEDRSGTDAHRLRGEVSYRNSFSLFRRNYLHQNHTFYANSYREKDKDFFQNHYILENDFRLVNNLFKNVQIVNYYQYDEYWYESPFAFDQGEEKKLLESSLRYNLHRKFDLNLNSGYDFLEEEYEPLRTFIDYLPVEHWKLSLGTEYDLNDKLFSENLIIKSIYDDQKHFVHKLGLQYDLNDSYLERLDNQFIYRLDGDYGWYLESNLSLNYDYEDSIREANIQLKKNFHCRELAFSYDYIEGEYTIQYSINLFPAQKIGFSRTEDDLLFDLGIEEMLEED
jgi:LPS export ABC transporter permease LptF